MLSVSDFIYFRNPMANRTYISKTNDPLMTQATCQNTWFFPAWAAFSRKSEQRKSRKSLAKYRSSPLIIQLIGSPAQEAYAPSLPASSQYPTESRMKSTASIDRG